MLLVFVLANTVVKTYFQSVKRDMSNKGFEVVLITAAISWVGILILVGTAIFGKFHIPTDPYFFYFWFGLSFITTVQLALSITGLTSSKFLAANSFSHLGFLVNTIYAVLFLSERLAGNQIFALIMAFSGALFFLKSKVQKVLLRIKGLC